MTSIARLFAVVWVAVAIVSWLCAVVAYVRMMRTIPTAVARLHMARLRIRGSLLFLAAPQLFVGLGATWRRRYIAALLIFTAAIVAAGVASAFAPG